MKLQKLAGATSEIWQVFVRDSSSTTGGGLTGLVFNSASLTAYYHRDTDTTATAMTLVTMTVGTFTSLGFKEIDATNMPGWYQFCPPNAAIASGAKSCAFHLKGATNMAPLPIEVQLTAVNPDSATAFMTSVATVTTVTNQLTAAQIATGVWQDATAGDFTAASSIGKTLYIANVAPGSANGLAIVGSAMTLAAGQKVDVDTIKTNPVVNAGTVTFPTNATLASTTNITAGTITTATNVTTVNGLAAGVITAASIAAAALNGKGDWLVSSSYPSNFSALAITAGGAVTAGTVSDKTGYALTAAYDAAKTAAQAGDAMTLTSGGYNAAADALLGRNVAGGSSTGRIVKEALYVLRNKVDVPNGHVYGTDDSTIAFSFAVTTAAGDPITVYDPT